MHQAHLLQMQAYRQKPRQRFDNDRRESSLPVPALPGDAPVYSHTSERQTLKNRSRLIKRHGCNLVFVVARYEGALESSYQPRFCNDHKPLPAKDPVVPRVACSPHISMHEYMHAKALDRYLQHVAHSASVHDTGSFCICCLQAMKCPTSGRPVKEEVESLPYRLGSGHNRFSDNLHRPRETEDLQ